MTEIQFFYSRAYSRARRSIINKHQQAKGTKQNMHIKKQGNLYHLGKIKKKERSNNNNNNNNDYHQSKCR